MGGFDNPYDDEEKLLNDLPYMFNRCVWITPRLAISISKMSIYKAECNLVQLKVKEETI